jgi:hypothetical protein
MTPNTQQQFITCSRKALNTIKPFYYVHLTTNKRVIETTRDGKKVGLTLLTTELLTPWEVKGLELDIIDTCTIIIQLFPVDHRILFGVRRLTTSGRVRLAQVLEETEKKRRV